MCIYSANEQLRCEDMLCHIVILYVQAWRDAYSLACILIASHRERRKDISGKESRHVSNKAMRDLDLALMMGGTLYKKEILGTIKLLGTSKNIGTAKDASSCQPVEAEGKSLCHRLASFWGSL